MKVPSKVIVDNIAYDVEVVPGSVLDTLMADQGPSGTFAGTHAWGLTKILIENDKSPQRTARILLHEILHGCLSGYENLTRAEEEKLVLHLESQLAGLIKNNPKVMQYFKETL
jgi:hypothetical protein